MGLGFRSVRGALEFYYAYRATGGLRASKLDPEEALGGSNPDGAHDRPLLVGKIGRCLERLGPAERKILARVHGPDRLCPDAAQARRLERAEYRLSRHLLAAGVLHADLLLDGWDEFTAYVGAPGPALRKILLTHPVKRFIGRRFQTLKPWVDDWLEVLPREIRHRLGVGAVRGQSDR